MSLWSDAKDLARYLADRRRSVSVQVAYAARLGDDCKLGNDISIGRRSRVYDCRIGDHVRICEDSRLTSCRLEGQSVIAQRCELGTVELGRYSYISSDARAGNIGFGRFCSVGPEFSCGWGEHPTHFLSTSPIFYSTQKQCGISWSGRTNMAEWTKISVGNDVWIGARVFIRDGVTIGNGAIIAAGSIVVKDVPAYAMVGGVPAKLIRFRFPEDQIAALERLAWWNWDEERLKLAQPTIAQSDPQALLDWSNAH